MTLALALICFASGALCMLVALVLLARGEKSDACQVLRDDEAVWPDGRVRRFSSVERAQMFRREYPYPKP